MGQLADFDTRLASFKICKSKSDNDQRVIRNGVRIGNESGKQSKSYSRFDDAT